MTTEIGLFKNYIQRLRNIELNDVTIIVGDNISPKLYEYMHLLDRTKFVDDHRHTYCGELKKITNDFTNYWMDVVTVATRQVDRCNNISKDELQFIMENTINIHHIKQFDFGKEFLPVETPLEQKIYDEIEVKYKQMTETLYEMYTKVQGFEKPYFVKKFVKDYFDMPVKKMEECFMYTHAFIAVAMSEKVREIRSSLEDTLIRVRNNLKQLQAKRSEEITKLRNQMYDRHKDKLFISRMDRRNSVASAEVNYSIRRIREKIEDPQVNNNMLLKHLQQEVQYWEMRLEEFDNITNTLNKIKKAKENVIDVEKEFNIYRTTELPGSRFSCWLNIAENIKNRKEYLDEKMLSASKALITFFGVQGLNRIFYRDNIGRYTMDEYGHQIYNFDQGSKNCHVTCDGTFREVKYTDRYYYDDYGRYIIDETGEKVYQITACTSTYKLGHDSIFIKTTKDCGHSTKVNPKCKMDLKDPTDVEILPDMAPMNIEGTLKPEVVKYLWDSFGHIVPEVLRGVGVMLPKNPIHNFAHKLICHKYKLTLDQLKKAVEEGEQYRANIYMKRKEKAIAENKEWKSKQVKRRKPEESDDSMHWAVYNAYLSQNQWINTLNDLYFD